MISILFLPLHQIASLDCKGCGKGVSYNPTIMPLINNNKPLTCKADVVPIPDNKAFVDITTTFSNSGPVRSVSQISNFTDTNFKVNCSTMALMPDYKLYVSDVYISKVENGRSTKKVVASSIGPLGIKDIHYE